MNPGLERRRLRARLEQTDTKPMPDTLFVVCEKGIPIHVCESREAVTVVLDGKVPAHMTIFHIPFVMSG